MSTRQKEILLGTLSLVTILCNLRGAVWAQEQMAEKEKSKALNSCEEDRQAQDAKIAPDMPKTQKKEDSQLDLLYNKYKYQYILIQGGYIGPFDFGISSSSGSEKEAYSALTRWAVGEQGFVGDWRVVQILDSKEMLALGIGTGTQTELAHLSGWATAGLVDTQEWHGDIYDEHTHSFGARIAIVGTYTYATPDGGSNTVLDVVPLALFQKGLTKGQFVAMLDASHELPSDLMEFKLETASKEGSNGSEFAAMPLEKMADKQSIDVQFGELYGKYRRKCVLLKGEYFGPFDFGFSDTNEMSSTTDDLLIAWRIGERGKVECWRIVTIIGAQEMLAVGDGKGAGYELVYLVGWPTAQLLNDREWYGGKTNNPQVGTDGTSIAIIGTYTYTTVANTRNTVLKAIPLRFFQDGLTRKQFLDMLKIRYDLPPDIMDLKAKLKAISFTIESAENDVEYDNRVETVTHGFLPGYEQTTVKNAFESFFSNPKWEFQVAPNGSQYVLFSGKSRKPVQLESDTVLGRRYLKQTILKDTTIIFKFVIQKNTYREFAVTSVDVEEDEYGEAVEMGERQIDSLIETIYSLNPDDPGVSEKQSEAVGTEPAGKKSEENTAQQIKVFYDKWLSKSDRENLSFEEYLKAIENYKDRFGKRNLDPKELSEAAIDAQFLPTAKAYYEEWYGAGLNKDIPLEEFVLAAEEYRERSDKVLYWQDWLKVQTKVAGKNWWRIKKLSECNDWSAPGNDAPPWEQLADALERYRRAKDMTIADLVFEINVDRAIDTVRKNWKDYLPGADEDWKSYVTGYYQDYLTKEFKARVSVEEFLETAAAYKEKSERLNRGRLLITDLAQVRRSLWMKEYQKGTWR